MKARAHAIHLALICILAAAVYAPVINAPFQWDEMGYILKNPFVLEPGLVLEPGGLEGHRLYRAFWGRPVGYFSFALNYALGGDDPVGYHMVNTALHMGNAALLYWLVLLLLATPRMRDSALYDRRAGLALCAAVLWAVHPLHTEAVTYVFQRHVLFAALFSLLAACLYLRSRYMMEEGAGGRGPWALYAGTVLAVLLAMKSKETAFTLPLMIMLMEVVFLTGAARRRALLLVPVLLTMLVVPVSLVNRDAHGVIGGLAAQAGNYAGLEGKGQEYFLTQSRVVLTYQRLLAFPVNQNLYYDYPVYSKATAPVVFAWLVHAALLGGALWAIARGGRRRPWLLVVGFGVAWFYLALAVESSLVPIPMFINEYRVYLPSAGLMMAGVVLFVSIVPLRAGRAVALSLLVLFSVLTFERNALWADRVALWQDVVAKSPGRSRAYGNLGNTYYLSGRIEDAIAAYERELALDPSAYRQRVNLGIMRMEQGRYVEGAGEFREALRLQPGLGVARYNLAAALYLTGRPEEALRELETLLAAEPRYPRARELMERIRSDG